MFINIFPIFMVLELSSLFRTKSPNSTFGHKCGKNPFKLNISDCQICEILTAYILKEGVLKFNRESVT